MNFAKLVTSAACALVFGAAFTSIEAKASDVIGYVVLQNGQFGTLDLTTGNFSFSGGSLGLTGAGLGVANGSLFAASYDTSGTCSE